MSETISPTFTFAKDGVFYFSRRIPKALRCHYSSSRIAYSLRTRSAKIAEARARKAVRAVTNFAASEQGLTLNNPFAAVYYDRTAGVSGRNSIPKEALGIIQRKCREANDDLRWLVAMVSDTGMRLAEAAGLAKEDIVLQEDGSLFARVRPHGAFGNDPIAHPFLEERVARRRDGNAR